MFNSLTGCDTLPSFASYGKKTAWAIWNVLPELTDALLKLSSAQNEIPKEVLHTIERFVILHYDRKSSYTDIDKARKKLFARKNNVELIPPTKAALAEHVERAAYQGGHVWGQVLLPAPELLAATSRGGTKVRTGCMIPTGQDYHKQPEVAVNCCHVNVRWVMWIVANAKMLHWNVLLCACVRGSAPKTRHLLHLILSVSS